MYDSTYTSLRTDRVERKEKEEEKKIDLTGSETILQLRRIPRNNANETLKREIRNKDAILSLTAAEGEQHEGIDEEKLDNVYYHPPEGNLERAEMRIHAEYVNELQKAETRTHSNRRV